MGCGSRRRPGITRLETARGLPRAEAGREPMRVRDERAVWP